MVSYPTEFKFKKKYGHNTALENTSHESSGGVQELYNASTSRSVENNMMLGGQIW